MKTSGARVPASPASSTDRARNVPAGGPLNEADEDLRLARLHLRIGMHATARGELEDLGGRGALDLGGIAALAEARWRTGDADGAADAADAHLAGGGGDPVAIVIAAEAAALAGDAADARALMARLGTADPVTIDAIFAGIPRRAHWPAAGPAIAAATAAGTDSARTQTAPGIGTRSGAGRASAVPGPAEVLQSSAGLWADVQPTAGTARQGTPIGGEPPAGGQPPMIQPTGVQPAAGQAWTEPARAKGHADLDAELETARVELDEAPERGLLRLALALRLDPTLARDVLEAVRLRREPSAVLLRGDAERLLGRHLEAEAAFSDAIELIERQAMPGSTPPDWATPARQHQEDS